MKNQNKAYLYAFITVLLWSTVATAFKIALRELNNIQLLVIANSTSLFVFFIILAFQKKIYLLKQVNIHSLVLSALMGFLNPFAYYLILFKAYSILPAQVAQPVNFIWPVVLMVLSVPLLKQPLQISGILGLLISFTGVLILASQGQMQHFRIAEPVGILLSLLSSIIWALFWIVNLKDKRDDLIKLFMSFAFSMVYILLLAWTTHDIYQLFSRPILPALYVGLFEMGISFVFWLKALQFSNSTGKVANLIYLTPFLSLLVIYFVLHEELYYTSFIGLCFIVAGIITGRIKKGA